MRRWQQRSREKKKGRLSQSLLSDRLGVFVHSLSLHFTVLVRLLTQGLSRIVGSFYIGMYTLREFPPSNYLSWHGVVTINFTVSLRAAPGHLHPVRILSPSSVRLQWSTALQWSVKLPCASSYRCTASMELQSSATSPPKTHRRGRTSSTKPCLTSLQR